MLYDLLTHLEKIDQLHNIIEGGGHWDYPYQARVPTPPTNRVYKITLLKYGAHDFLNITFVHLAIWTISIYISPYHLWRFKAKLESLTYSIDVSYVVCIILLYFTATQIWCLARLLPLMISHRVAEDNEHWKNFLLLSVLDIVFAPIVSTDCVAHMKVLINEHHENFWVLCPTCSIIPKMQYMVHYPECIER